MNEALVGAGGIFQGIDPDTVKALTAQLQPTSFPRGHIVFREGEVGDQMYIITSGRVKVGQTTGSRGNLIAILGPADMFGELAVFDPGPRTSTVTTLIQVKAMVLSRPTLQSWLAERPEIAEQLLRVLARRLRRTNDILCDQVFTDVPGRVAKLLLDLASRFGRPDHGVVRIDHELTQIEIAQLAGSTRESVNKALIMFAGRGWIRQQGKTMFICAPDALAGRTQ